MFWDDGVECNAYVVANDNSRSRVRFKGKAKISDDWSAGYLLEIGVRTANSKRTNQNDDDALDNSGLDIRHSYWYLDSKKLGRVSVGHTGAATEGITAVDLASIPRSAAEYCRRRRTSGLGSTLAVRSRVMAASRAMQLAPPDRRHAASPAQANVSVAEVIKYDTPETGGFAGTAAFARRPGCWDFRSALCGRVRRRRASIGRRRLRSRTLTLPACADGRVTPRVRASDSAAISEVECNSGSVELRSATTKLMRRA